MATATQGKKRTLRPRGDVPSRDRILKTASRLFATKGYAATSMDEVAAAAEASKSSIYWHFKSKEDILLELLKHTTTDWITQAIEVVATAGTPLEKYDVIAEKTFEEMKSSQETLRLILGMMTERSEVHPRTREAIQQVYRNYRDTMTRELKKVFPYVSARVLNTVGTVMLAASDGLFLQWQLEPDAVNPKQVFDSIRELLSPVLKLAEAGMPKLPK